jgi:hypothetical protein
MCRPRKINEYKITDGIVRIRVKASDGTNHVVWIDEIDKHWLDSHSVRVCKVTGTYFSARLYGSNLGGILARRILSVPRELVIDHINENPLDNRRCNLRIVTQAENTQNSDSRSLGSSSGYRGVTYRKDNGLWAAQAQINKVKSHLGMYRTKEEAAKVASDFRAKNMPFSKDARLASQA